MWAVGKNRCNVKTWRCSSLFICLSWTVLGCNVSWLKSVLLTCVMCPLWQYVGCQSLFLSCSIFRSVSMPNIMDMNEGGKFWIPSVQDSWSHSNNKVNCVQSTRAESQEVEQWSSSAAYKTYMTAEATFVGVWNKFINEYTVYNDVKTASHVITPFIKHLLSWVSDDFL